MEEPFNSPPIARMSGGPRLLVHICCGPCSIYPLKQMLKGRARITGFFYNPNIHPHSEFRKRLDAVKTLARFMRLDVICMEEYRPIPFIKGLKEHAHTEEGIPAHGLRCGYCYYTRLHVVAAFAKARGFDMFTTSLLYSRRQDHELVKEAGLDASKRYGIPFFYEDFRVGWKEGIEDSKAIGLYRQNYCGCIYSRIERFSSKKKKKEKSVAGKF